MFGYLEDVSVRDMRRVFDTVFWGVVHGSREAVRHFRERGGPGALINVGSFFGDRATPLQSTYSSAKFAVHGFTEALRVELAAEKAPVSVTLVHPGRIDTPYNDHAQSYMDRVPAHRGMVYPPERSEEHTSELQSRQYLVCRLLLEKQNDTTISYRTETNCASTPSSCTLTS